MLLKCEKNHFLQGPAKTTEHYLKWDSCFSQEFGSNDDIKTTVAVHKKT